MKVFFGKIEKQNEYNNFKCISKRIKYFGGINPGDYAFIRVGNDGANVSRLWKLEHIIQDSSTNEYIAQFDSQSVLTFNEIHTDELVLLKLFKIDVNLAQKTKGRGVDFIELTLTDSSEFLNCIQNQQTFESYVNNSANSRKIVVVPNDTTAPSDINIQLIKENNTFVLYSKQKDYLERNNKDFLAGIRDKFKPSRYTELTDALNNDKNFRDSGQKPIPRRVKKWLDDGGTGYDISLNNLYDMFCSDQPMVNINNHANAINPNNTFVGNPSGQGVNNMNIEDELKKYIEVNNFKQIVLTGAPGTGKTYSVKKYVGSGTNMQFVQFHPSYDYSDFVEGLRPIMFSTSGNPTFVRMDGIFKEFCRKVVEENYENSYNVSLQKLAKNNEITYEDFVRGYAETESSVQQKYFFIIDEINRADLSKVFGELMYCLETSYRGINNRIKTQYSNLTTYVSNNGVGEEIKFDCFKNGFFIPNNVYIIGTMNDIDRSVEAFDFALRRRFEWIDIQANEVFHSGATEMLKSLSPQQIDDLTTKAQNMNNVISNDGKYFMLNDAYHIGHAYFKSYDGTDASLKRIFETNITSILKEYTRGRNKQEVEDRLIKPCRDALGVK